MDDEEEMDFVGGSGNSGRDFEMNDVGSGDKKKDWSVDSIPVQCRINIVLNWCDNR